MTVTDLTAWTQLALQVAAAGAAVVGAWAGYQRLREGMTKVHEGVDELQREQKAAAERAHTWDLALGQIKGRVESIDSRLAEHVAQDRESFAALGERADKERQARHDLASVVAGRLDRLTAEQGRLQGHIEAGQGRRS